MNVAHLSPLANHLWQSTLFAATAGLLTFAFRKNRATVRYWIWFSASVKFLIPFSLLVSLGTLMGTQPAPGPRNGGFSFAINEISQPFEAPPNLSTTNVTPKLDPMALLIGVWLCGSTIAGAFWVRSSWQIRAIRRAARPLPLHLPIKVMSSASRLEPGVIGIREPVLLLPDGIMERLTPSQLEAVLAHELCHVHRRDNLTAAIHMLVEIIFWFHPFVWWIRAKLIVERERACDEQVIATINDPQDYAEGILNICKLYLESPLACMSGITGADLKKRIEMIMGCHIAERLNLSRKCLLFIAGGVALTTPISIGILTAPTLQAQSLADPPVSYVASIKPNKAMDVHTFSEYSASGRLTATGVTVASLLRIAYHIQPYQLIGAPAWISTKRYDINAKVDDNPPPSQQILLKALLRDRFKLLVHNETRELPIFALVVARRDGKLGPQLTKSAFDCAAYFAGPHAPPQPGHALNCATNIGPGSLFGKAIPMSQLATSLAPFVSRFTVDKTGLTGGFDVELTWSPDEVSPNITGNAPNDTAPVGQSLFVALQEQLGLKLVSEKGPAAVLVVDHLEEPSAN